MTVAQGGIGITNVDTYAGNTISDNGFNGITVYVGASAYIGGNTITRNGTRVAPGAGVLVYNANASIVGNNEITDNAGSGVIALGAAVVIGDANFGLPTMNTISGNGTSTPFPNNGGVLGFLGSSLDIRDATIRNNTGNGVLLSTQSQARMIAATQVTIQNNTLDGINILRGSGLFLATPITVSDNARWGLRCVDGSSHFEGNVSGIHDNGEGDVECSGF